MDTIILNSRGRRVNEKNKLSIKYPHLIEEWDFELNCNITPDTVSYGSEYSAWWIGKKCGHKWQAMVKLRSRGSGCPTCNRDKATKSNCIAAKKPELVKEWNYEKNGALTPYTVSYGSDKYVWWKCIHGHSWLAMVKHRYRGIGCQECKKLGPS